MAPHAETSDDRFLLRRSVRFAINDALPVPPAASAGPATQIHNSFAGAPAIAGLGRHYELVVACRGGVDAHTGYFLNIKEIDAACRRRAIPLITEALAGSGAGADPARLLAGMIAAMAEELPGHLHSVRWKLTPYHSLEMSAAAPNAPSASVVLMRQVFEFAAAHRLYVAELTEDENRRLFGKCTNKRGHGHNYKVEPCVAVPLAPEGARPGFTLADLERLTDETIIERFDHKHLNEDTPEFGPGANGKGGLNPSVENIAKVCYELLAAAIERHNPAARLASITVWETDKTTCTYPACDK
jgi:6-pyruvoyltetrahydropterin/6-carboxytetrahydropterin synthase